MRYYVGLCASLAHDDEEGNTIYVTDDIDCMPPSLLAEPPLLETSQHTAYEAAWRFSELHGLHGPIIINTSEEYVEASL